MGWVGLGPLYSKSTKNLKGFFNAFQARLDKIWLHQAVKFDFMGDLAGTDNRSERAIK